MSKQVVVVVHGVNVKQAGVSSDLLATALDEIPEANVNKTRKAMDGARLRPHSSDDFHLREFREFNRGDQRQVFPARIRRYRDYEPESGAIRGERVIADFFWGDITSVGPGAFGLIVGIVKTILGLSHIIRENAKSVFPQKHGVDTWMRRFASWGALSIHGPIAAMNILLVLGVLIHAGLAAGGFEKDSGTDVILTLVASLGASLFLSRSNVYLTRLLGHWIFYTALLLLFLHMLDAIAGAFGFASLLGAIDTKLTALACLGADSTNCQTAFTGIFMPGLRLIALQNVVWLAFLALSVLVMIGEAVRRWRSPEAKPKSVVSAGLGLMMLTWIILIGAIWAAIAAAKTAVLPDGVALRPFLGALIACISFLIFILVSEGLVYWRTHSWSKKQKTGGDGLINLAAIGPDQSERNRLIISGFAIWLLRLFVVVMVLEALGTTAQLAGYQTDGFWFLPILQQNSDTFFKWLIAGLALLGAFAFSYGNEIIRAGLSIALDVITWLNDHSWRDGDNQTLTLNRIEQKLPKIMQPEKNEGYFKRRRITDRLRVLTEQILRDENPEDLVFVTHSQGTVVAMAALEHHGSAWKSMMKEGGTIRLVTMGSPYTHVHNHYFPQSFPPPKAIPNLAGASPQGLLTQWINIFRIDDFVGTFIDPAGMWPKERPVKANGHTNYWTDENVFRQLKDIV